MRQHIQNSQKIRLKPVRLFESDFFRIFPEYGMVDKFGGWIFPWAAPLTHTMSFRPFSARAVPFHTNKKNEYFERKIWKLNMIDWLELDILFNDRNYDRCNRNFIQIKLWRDETKNWTKTSATTLPNILLMENGRFVVMTHTMIETHDIYFLCPYNCNTFFINYF